MEGWIFLAKSPYYALSDEEGRFTMDEIPPGHYQIKAWHPILGAQEGKVKVEAGKVSPVGFKWSGKP